LQKKKISDTMKRFIYKNRIMKKTISWVLTTMMIIQTLFPAGGLSFLGSTTQAAYLQNDNAGTFELTFPNSEGILSSMGMTITG
jgi:hypothetical protein